MGILEIDNGDNKSASSPNPKSTTGNVKKNVSWKNVNFSINGHHILKDVYGEVHSGEICAIMGPSGSGKTSLLNVLAGRSSSGGSTAVSGTIGVNGHSINPIAYRQKIAYVMQDDHLIQTATPRETLRFSAKLRLPPDTSEEFILEKVEKLLVELNLAACANVMVGGPLIQGISGGQRKRTSVGVEIITDPNILFLDEPTSGLDSYTAFSLLKTLNNVAAKNCPVLCTIHQPSSEVFYLFHIAIFLKEGRVMWQGATKDLVANLSGMGYEVPNNYNPCDFAMFICQTEDTKSLDDKGWFHDSSSDIHIEGENVEDMKTSLLKEASEIGANLMHLDSKEKKTKEKYNDAANDSETPVIKASFWTQLKELSHRDARQLVRDVQALKIRFGATVFLNLIYGLIFLNAGRQDDGDKDEFGSHYGAIVMVSISSMFGAAQPMMLSFPFERPMFLREYGTGTYSARAYFLSKWTLELPLALAQVLTQYIIVYNLIGFQGSFVQLVIAALLNGVTASSLALVVGCAVPNVKTVTELAPLLFVPQLLFSGFFIRTELVPVFLRWAQYLCGLKYSLNLIVLTEFDPGNDNCSDSVAAATNCATLLSANQVHKEEYWIYLGLLLAVFFLFRITAGFILIGKANKFY